MKTSIATVSISGSLEGKLRAVAEAGFDGVEIFENDLLGFPGTPREVGRIIRDLGMQCTLFQPFRDLEGMPAEQLSRAFERIERKFDVMQELGTDLILLCSNCSPLAVGDRPRLIDDLSALGERAAKRGMRVGYEALAWARHTFDHRDAWSLIRDVDHPSIGLILDSFHSLARGIPSASIGDIRVDKLFFVQIADAPRLTMDYLSWSRHFRNMPGQGDLPLAEFAEAIHRLGYQGYWSLEIFNDRFRAGSASGVAVDGYRSLQLLHDEVASRPRSPIKAAMPPRVDVKGVEFIEFAASDEEAQALGSMLTALGFVADSAAPPQSRHALAAGRHQHRHELRARRSRSQLRCRARCVGLRARPQGNERARRLGARRAARDPPFHAGGRARRAQDSVREGCRRQPHLFHRGRQRGGGLAPRVHATRADRRSAALVAARTDGSYCPDDAIRGVPVLAPLLRGAVQRREDAADRDRRHARARAEPGRRVAGSRAADYVERLDGSANAVGAILTALHGRRVCSTWPS